MEEKPCAPHVSPENLDITAPNQQDYKYDPSAPVADPSGPKIDPSPNAENPDQSDSKLEPTVNNHKQAKFKIKTKMEKQVIGLQSRIDTVENNMNSGFEMVQSGMKSMAESVKFLTY